MCLTIPKKVVEIKENSVVVESHDGSRQEIKTIVRLGIGDYVATQQNVVIEKIKREDAEEILNMINTKGDF